MAENIEQTEGQNQDGQKNTGMAILCYLGILLIIPLVTDAKDEPFVKFHLKQGIVLLIAGIINFVIFMIPILGWVIGFILWIIILVLVIIGLINVVTGKEKQLPLIGKYADQVKI